MKKKKKQDFVGAKALDVNSLLKTAGMFHGLHAISRQFSSNPGM